MRFVTLLAVVALLAVSANAAPLETSSDHIQKFSTHDPRPYPPTGEAGGESFADAVDMVMLPFTDSGNLWDYADDLDFGYGTSPDCVYQYTPDFDGCITVDLCGSDYDSMLWIIAADMATIVAWNDDGAACDAFQSQISWMYVYTGELLYYVIDGYGGSAGPFVFDVFTRDCPPPVECPPGAIIEGEGCADPYDDEFNSGCNGLQGNWSMVECAEGQIVICGTIFNMYTTGGGGARDTDWYQLTNMIDPLDIHATSYYESSGSLYYIIADPDCSGAVSIPAGIHIGSRELGELDFTTDPLVLNGVFQSKNYYDGTWYTCTDPESWPYVLTIDGFTCPVVPNETETWGGVKNLFK